MADIPTTELGFVDIRKHVYDTLVNYVPLIGKIGTNNVHFWDTNKSIATKKRPFVAITKLGGNTNHIGIREQEFQIDVFTTTIEETESIGDIIINLFNRANLGGIRSKLTRLGPDQSNEKTGTFRQSMDFLFVFKDMKF